MLNKTSDWISLGLILAGALCIGLSLLFTPTPDQASAPGRVVVSSYDGDSQTAVLSRERLPANLLAEASIPLFPGDQLIANGQPIEHDTPLKDSSSLIQVQPAMAVVIIDQSGPRELFHPPSTMIKVLWDEGVRLTSADDISTAPITMITAGSALALRPAIPIQINTSGRAINRYSAAATTGQALAASGLPLQGLNLVEPPEDQPLPPGGILQVIVQHEEISQTESAIAYTTERQADFTLLDSQEVIVQGGQEGRASARIRTRYADGVEFLQTIERQVVLAEPQAEIIAFGTKPETIISLPSTDTIDDAPFEYWASKQMYATSYYPCGFVNRCSYVTASGQTLQKGVVAVSLEWYRALAGQRVYIPGYGTAVIADAGGGIPGKDWIDLGYSNEDYIPWSGWVEVYFLPPAPASIPWFLQ